MGPDSTSACIPEQLSDDSPHSWVIMSSSSSDWSPSCALTTAPPNSEESAPPILTNIFWKPKAVRGKRYCACSVTKIYSRPHLKHPLPHLPYYSQRKTQITEVIKRVDKWIAWERKSRNMQWQWRWAAYLDCFSGRIQMFLILDSYELFSPFFMSLTYRHDLIIIYNYNTTYINILSWLLHNVIIKWWHSLSVLSQLTPSRIDNDHILPRNINKTKW